MENNDRYQPPRTKRDRKDRQDRTGDPDGGQPDNTPAAAENTSGLKPPGKTDDPSSADANGNWRKPITNQDEQEKITNQEPDEPNPAAL